MTKDENGIADKNFVIAIWDSMFRIRFGAASGTTSSAYCAWMTITGIPETARSVLVHSFTYSIVGSNVSIADIQRLKTTVS